MEFHKLSSPSLRELFVEQLIGMILSDKLKIGEKLPSERQLAESMQVSRAVVNNGISDLEKMGFLIVKPRSGTYIADYRRRGTLETLTAIMKYNGGRIRNDEIRSILEIRSALDCLAAELCVSTISDENIALLYKKVEQIRTAQSVSEASEAAFGFQHEFGLISGNTLIPLIMQSFKTPIFTLWDRFCSLYGIEALYQSNYQMWTFIKNRDTQGTLDWIHKVTVECSSGKWTLSY